MRGDDRPQAMETQGLSVRGHVARRRSWLTRIVDRRVIAPDVIEISVSRPPGFDFDAGQHVQLGVLALDGRDPHGRSRVFSITSSPNDRDILAVAFRRSPSAYKRTLAGLAFGSTVRLSGPYGHVTLTRKSDRPRVLVAFGVGITPHVSMIRFASEEALTVPIAVLHVANHERRVAYADELTRCAAENPAIRLLARSSSLALADLERARDEHPHAIWYLSGPPTRVGSAVADLRGLGVPERDIFTEEFIGY